MAIISLSAKDLLTINQAAKALNISRITVYRWLKSGRLHGFVVGDAADSKTFIPVSEVDRIKINRRDEDTP